MRQVIEFADIVKVDQYGDPLEAALMLKLKHPNIIETIQYTTQLRAVSPLLFASTPARCGTGVGVARLLHSAEYT